MLVELLLKPHDAENFALKTNGVGNEEVSNCVVIHVILRFLYAQPI